MTIDQDFLLYPLATADLPNCPACGGHMVVALHEVRDKRPDFSTFRCDACARSERYVCEE
jgi:transposase-like protein